MPDDKKMAAIDARTLVPVGDDAGGVVVYVAGRVAYYVMNGEWFAAVPEPIGAVSEDAPRPTAGPGRSRPLAFDLERLVSTS